MNSAQAINLCDLFGMNPNEAIGTEPRYVAVQRVFDTQAAEDALKAHNEYWSKPRSAPKATGEKANSLNPADGTGAIGRLRPKPKRRDAKAAASEVVK